MTPTTFGCKKGIQYRDFWSESVVGVDTEGWVWFDLELGLSCCISFCVRHLGVEKE